MTGLVPPRRRGQPADRPGPLAAPRACIGAWIVPLTPKDRHRATVLSTMEQADSISQVTIGPGMGVIGQAGRDPGGARRERRAAGAVGAAPCCVAGDGPTRHAADAREDRRVIFDPELVRRIESSAARVSTGDGRRRSSAAPPTTRPARVPFGDGALVAFGPGRYVNRAVGVSLDDIDDAGLDELEAFYAASGVPPSLEVASWCPAVAARAARPARLRRVVVPQRLRDGARRGRAVPPHPTMGVREVVDDDARRVARAAAPPGNEIDARRGRASATSIARAAHAVAGATDFLADLDGTPLGCGSLSPRRRHRLARRGGDRAGGAPARRAGRAGAPPHGGRRHATAATSPPPRPGRPATRPATCPASASRSPTARPC